MVFLEYPFQFLPICFSHCVLISGVYQGQDILSNGLTVKAIEPAKVLGTRPITNAQEPFHVLLKVSTPLWRGLLVRNPGEGLTGITTKVLSIGVLTVRTRHFDLTGLATARTRPDLSFII
jgi:hypothetical protein